MYSKVGKRNNENTDKTCTINNINWGAKLMHCACEFVAIINA